MGPIVVDSGTPSSLGGMPEPPVRKNLFAAEPISPIVDQLDAGFMVAEAKIFRLCWAWRKAIGPRHLGPNSSYSLIPKGIAEGVQVRTLRTSFALTPSTGQGPQKQAKAQVATNSKSPKSPNLPIGAPHPRDPAGVPGMVRGERDRRPQRELRGTPLPLTGSGTFFSARIGY